MPENQNFLPPPPPGSDPDSWATYSKNVEQYQKDIGVFEKRWTTPI